MIETLVYMTVCIFFEARSECFDAKMMVGHSILNRSVRRKLTPAEVVKQPKQYSWYHERTQTIKIRDIEDLLKCAEVAVKCYARHQVGLRLGKVDHYYDDSINPPYWAASMKPLGKVGAFYYFKS